MWDTGVRVKKLKNTSAQVVFEARLNRGDRMLFTLGRDDSRSAIYVWGIHHHDDLNAKAKRIGLPENASFLFLETDDIEDFPELLIEDLAKEYMTQEAVQERAADDCGPQKWLVADTAELDRLLRAEPGADIELFLYITPEQKAVLDQSPPILISGTAGSGKTTIAVYYLLVAKNAGKKLFLTCSSHLKQFSERIYDGLMANREAAGLDAIFDVKAGPRPEFHTFREILRTAGDASGTGLDPAKEVRLKEFALIFANHPFARKYDAELVWEEIRSIVKGATPALSARRLRVLAEAYEARSARPREVSELCGYLLAIKSLGMVRKVERVRERKTGFADYDAFVQALESREQGAEDGVRLLLEQAVRQAEAQASTFDRPMLAFEDYEYLGGKRAPSFRFDRRDIYSIAEYYQQKLEETGRWDEIDLTRTVLRAMSKWEEELVYDLVVCDEIQDLADIQLSFLFRLARDPSSLVLTGDPKQIINPSGFRWEEVRNRFYERGVEVPDVFQLNLNFRSVGSIVRLANALLDLKQRTIGISGSELREDWKFNGRPPYLLYGLDDDKVLATVNLSGAGRIILTRSEAERDSLKHRLSTEMIFTIGEAKGLEFDTVLLWRFADSGQAAAVWRRMLRDEQPEESHKPHIRHEINLLYVAVTRSRNTLIIYDGPEQADVWRVKEIAQHLFPGEEISALEEAWRHISTPEEWERQGEYFYEREFYRHAAECFKNGGSKKRELNARARHFKAEGRYAEAGKAFEEAGELADAAQCHAIAKAWDRAAELYGATGDTDRRDACTAEQMEKEGKWSDAAALWKMMGNTPRLLTALERAGDYIRLGKLKRKEGDLSAAAAFFERGKNFAAAASCFEKLEEYASAASLYLNAKDFESAAPLYRRLHDTEKELLCYRKLRRYYDAAVLCEKSKNISEATDYFRQHAQLGEEQHKAILSEAKKPKLSKWKAALRYSALGMDREAAECYRASRLVREAADAYIRTGDHEKAGKYLLDNGRFREAIEAFEAVDEPDYDLIDLCFSRYTGKPFRYDFSYGWNSERIEEVSKDAYRLIRKGLYRAALARAKAIENEELIIELYDKLGKSQDAFEYFIKSEDYEAAGEYIDQIDTYHFDTDFITWLASDLASETRRFDLTRELDDIDLLSTVFVRAIDIHGTEYIERVCDAWLSELHWFFMEDTGDLPTSFTELLLSSKSYNGIANLLYSSKIFDKRDYPKHIKAFAEVVHNKGLETNDQLLLACASIVLSPSKTGALLAGITCNSLNVGLFSRTSRYREAVSVYLEDKRVDAALIACRRNHDFELLAELYEQEGRPKESVRTLLQAGLPKKALEYARRAGDDVGMARAYDHLGQYDEALSIWDKRGNKRDAARMRKKLADAKAKTGTQPEEPPAQLELFD